MSVPDLKARVETVPALASRVQTAFDFSELVRTKALPNVTPAAFVLPLGLNARSNGEASAGAFIQSIDDAFGVVLVLRTAGDVTGAKSQPELDTLVEDVIGAVVGEGPSDQPGVYALRRGRLLSMNAGTIFYQLDFAILKQLRKT